MSFAVVTEMTKWRDVSDVVDWRLCVGCGACAYICPAAKVELVDFIFEGIRPVVKDRRCESCDECLQVCPAVETDFRAARSRTPFSDPQPQQTSGEFEEAWGPILEIWEGYAADQGIRFKGSSGGALTALSAYCIEKLGMHGVLHIAQNPADAIRNQTRMSRTRDDLIAATGSRYSPASVCDHLEWVENALAPCVIIGRPAEIAAVNKARKLRPSLDAKVGVTLSFFCAESPSTSGTAALLNDARVPLEKLAGLRYRGEGWPGHFLAFQKGTTQPILRLTYRESWGFLQAYRPWSVHLWPDGTGELADISCGDPWYEEPDGNNPGVSLVIARTEQGKKIIDGAVKAGYLQLKRAEPWKLAKSQQNLFRKKAAVWGRLLALRACGLPVPKFQSAHLFKCWLKLSLEEKLKSILGTLGRIFRRKLYRPLRLDRNDNF
jgi:coenzyme F420 hydrogenase subunit beta